MDALGMWYSFNNMYPFNMFDQLGALIPLFLLFPLDR